MGENQNLIDAIDAESIMQWLQPHLPGPLEFQTALSFHDLHTIQDFLVNYFAEPSLVPSSLDLVSARYSPQMDYNLQDLCPLCQGIRDPVHNVPIEIAETPSDAGMAMLMSHSALSQLNTDMSVRNLPFYLLLALTARCFTLQDFLAFRPATPAPTPAPLHTDASTNVGVPGYQPDTGMAWDPLVVPPSLPPRGASHTETPEGPSSDHRASPSSPDESVRVVLEFGCKPCQRKFLRRHDLTRHSRIHNGEACIHQD